MGGKAKRVGLAGVTGGGSEVWRGLKNAKFSHSPTNRAGTPENRINAGFNNAELYLLPYDQLVSMGRIAPGTNPNGLQGGESRFSRIVSGYENSLAAADPIFQQYRDATRQGLEGIQNGGIPDDLRRTITEGLRSSQASRGILDSPTAAVEEVVRLMGGSEAVRSQRLAAASDYFRQVTGGAAASFLPDLSTYLGTESNSNAFNLQRGMAGQQQFQWGVNQGINVGSDIIGAIAAGSMGGGGMGTAGAAPPAPGRTPYPSYFGGS